MGAVLSGVADGGCHSCVANRVLLQLGDIQNILKSEQTRVSIKEDAVIAENYNIKQKKTCDLLAEKVFGCSK